MIKLAPLLLVRCFERILSYSYLRVVKVEEEDPAGFTTSSKSLYQL
jgi:hypothetical protein